VSLDPGCICGDWGVVEGVKSFGAPWRGIIGVSRGESPLESEISGRTAGTIEGEETTMVEGEWYFLEVSELERFRPVEPLISI